jgi:RimJ/RimL family protein N-acetyltransferase
MKAGRVVRRDKSGNAFEIGAISPGDVPFLLKMYREFSPKAQGLPPEDPETCTRWVENLFQIGENFLAWRGDAVIGHLVLIPDVERKSGELIIFIDESHRNLGIGTELTRFTLGKFGEFGFDSIWLTVSVLNFIAVRLYRKLGFEFCDADPYERVMKVGLRPDRDPAGRP